MGDGLCAPDDGPSLVQLQLWRGQIVLDRPRPSSTVPDRLSYCIPPSEVSLSSYRLNHAMAWRTFAISWLGRFEML